MKSVCLLFLVIFLAGKLHTTFAQEELSKIITPGFVTDTNQIKKMINRAGIIGKNTPDSAFVLLGKALSLSKKANYKTGVISALLCTGLIFVHERKYTQSKLYFDSAYYYSYIGSMPTNEQLVLIYNCMAVLYTLRGNNAAAVQYYYLALQEMSKGKISSDTAALALLYSNIGGTFSKLEQHSKALYYLEKGAVLARQTHDLKLLANIYENLGMTYENNGEYARSLHYYSRAIDFYKKNHFNRLLQSAYYGLGRNYLLQDSVSKAFEFFNAAVRADTLAAKNNSPLLQGLGGIYYKYGNYDQSEKLYKTALQICNQQELITDRLTIYSTLAKIYTKTQRYRLANQYQKLYADLNDSLNNEQRIKITNQLEVRYRVSEKNKELAEKRLLLLKQKNQIKEKNSWLIGIAAGTLLLILLLISVYRDKRHKDRLQQEQILNLEQEKEIHTLKAKMEGEEEERTRLARDLHDGVVVKFSAVKMNLSVLPDQHPSLKNATDFQKIIGNLDNATQELRKTAHNLMPDTLLESGLSEAVYYFCKDIQQNTGLVIDFQQYMDLPRLQPEAALSVYRIIQELLQNILKHAEATHAIVQLSYVEGLLNVTIEDDGKGFDPAAGKAQNGIGIKNIYARVAALNGQLDIESQPGKGTTVYLELDTKAYLVQETKT